MKIEPNVLILTSIPSYHQVDLFDELHRRDELKLDVIYLRPITPGRNWTRMPIPAHPHKFLTVWFNQKPWWFSPTVINHLERYCPDLLVVCQYAGIAYQAAMYWAAARGIPSVFWSESPGVKHFEVKNGVPERARPMARKMAFLPAKLWAKQVWGVGRRAQQQYEELVGRPCGNLPYYSTLSKFGRGEEPYAPGGTVRFLYAGRYSYRKGFDLLIEAMASLATRWPDKKWTLTLAGAGDLAPMLKRKKYEPLRARIQDMGFLELSEMSTLMRHHDVFLCPSRYDGWGMVVTEALAAGMPVLASDQVGSALDIGGRDCLRLFTSGSAQAFTAGVETFLENVKQIPRLGAEATATAMVYDSPRGAWRFVKMATEVLAMGGGIR
jgi:glycosyltransferase involved in cell wall biosynthesis